MTEGPGNFPGRLGTTMAKQRTERHETRGVWRTERRGSKEVPKHDRPIHCVLSWENVKSGKAEERKRGIAL